MSNAERHNEILRSEVTSRLHYELEVRIPYELAHTTSARKIASLRSDRRIIVAELAAR